MQVCSNCGHKNRPGVIFCENCGTSLLGRAAVGTTKSFEEGGVSAETRDQVSTAGTDIFLPGSNLRIEIEGGPEPILAQPKKELIFGRRDPATGAMPDVDLTPYAGYRMGVSRRHAAIRSGDDNRLDVWDLGSSNGTFLNGQRLNAHRPYRLRDGDQLRLGQMIIRIYFQPPPSALSDTGARAALSMAPTPSSGTAIPAAPVADLPAAPAEDQPVAPAPSPPEEAAPPADAAPSGTLFTTTVPEGDEHIQATGAGAPAPNEPENRAPGGGQTIA